MAVLFVCSIFLSGVHAAAEEEQSIFYGGGETAFSENGDIGSIAPPV